MKSPVGTVIVLPVVGMVSVTGWAMVCRRCWEAEQMVVEERGESPALASVLENVIADIAVPQNARR